MDTTVLMMIDIGERKAPEKASMYALLASYTIDVHLPVYGRVTTPSSKKKSMASSCNGELKLTSSAASACNMYGDACEAKTITILIGSSK